MDDLISRQAAIDALNKMKIYRPLDSDRYVISDCLNKIVNLPSAQPETEERTLTEDDYAYCMNCDHVEMCRWYPVYGCEFKSRPSAQPEHKTGKWIERNPQNSPDCRLIECSECGNAYIVGYNIDYDDWIGGRNFCMKCGADLRGGGNGKST